MNCSVERHGIVAYSTALEMQHHLHAQVAAGARDGVILILQHPSTITLGKNASLENLLIAKEDLQKSGIEFIHTDRGGDITAHNEGQIVIYPILPLKNLGPKKLVSMLEKSVIEVLAQFNIVAVHGDEDPGVWVQGKKICAVGLRVRNHVSMHGIALNVCNDLGIFDRIVPCGLLGKGVTRMIDHQKCSLSDVTLACEEKMRLMVRGL